MEACTVSIEINTYANATKFCYMSIENGEMKAKVVDGKSGVRYNLTDVVKGTLLTVADNGTNSVVYNIVSGDATIMRQFSGWNPASCILVNGDCTINCNPD